MSFWPFTSALSSNSALQTFLDSVQDVSAVTVEDLLGDPQLLQELCNELDNIKRNQNVSLSNFQFLQSQVTDTFSSNQVSSFDNVSLESSLNDTSNINSKDGRSLKLLEILLQPHILNGFLDYLVESVEYFYKEAATEQARIERLLKCAASASTTTDNAESSGTETHEPESTTTDNTPRTPNSDLTHIDPGGHYDNSIESMSTASRSTKGAGASEDEEQESEDERMRRCVEAACDILAIDLWVVLNRIIETPSIMSKLWMVISLEHLDECSPSVTYLVRILDQLMDANSIELLNFVRRQPDIAGMIIDKIDVPLLMEFFMRIIQTDKADSPTGILEMLSLQRLIPRLVDILKPCPSQFTDEESASNSKLFFKQMATSDFIKSFVAVSSNTALAPVVETNIGPNQLTRELVSREIISTMINDIILYHPPKTLDGKSQTNKHGINNCVGIIIELIRKNNSDYDLNCGIYSAELPTSENGVSEVNATVMCKWLSDFSLNPPGPRDPIYLGDMLELFSENLDKLNALMAVPPIEQYANEEPSLGMTNFRISELIAELLHCSNMILLNSHRMKQVRRLRDYVRAQQTRRLQVALADELSQESGPDTSHLHNMCDRLDDIEFSAFNTCDGGEELPTAEDIQALSLEEDSDDEEPVISPERPFVCGERDAIIRKRPCTGDYFKIRLLDLGLLVNIIRKFTEFPWNNFFHNVVFDLVQQIFNGKLNSYNSFLIVELFEPSRCSLTSLIYHAYNDCAEPRPGYMGHLVLISEEVVKFTSLYKPDLISPVIVAAVSSQEWEQYVTDTLTKTREMYNVVLGGEEGLDSDDFDPNGMGYLDEDGEPRSKGVIVLGDVSNQKQFASDVNFIKSIHDEDDDEDDDILEEAKMPEVPVQRMSPSGSVPSANEDHNGEEEYFPQTEFLDTSDTDSSEDEMDPDAPTSPQKSPRK